MVRSKPPTLFIVLPSIIAIAALIVSLYLMVVFSSPLDPAGMEKKVTIRKGLSVVDIGRILQRAGVIKGRRTFVLLALLEGQTRKLKAGEYRLSPAMSLSEVLDALREGRVHYNKTVIPEGSTLKEIAAILERKGLVTAREFLDQAADGALLTELNIGAESLEGYLFPDTYLFPSGVGPEEIIQTMYSELREHYTPPLQSRAGEMGMGRHQVLTLASIIEEEAKTDRERPLISGVFHNRLRRGMPLQADPTVRYALGGYRGPLTSAHLKTPSPYNTYLHQGLPPGPISNPGLSSIEAALNPAATDYLYFVADGDGTHRFSSTLREHNRAVRSLRNR